MFKPTYRILISGLRSARAEVQSAIAAHGYYQKPTVSRSVRAYCWVQGFCAGISRAMLEHREQAANQACFSDAYPQVRFSVHQAGGAVLLIEVVTKDSDGRPVSVSSTLNPVEARTIYAGLATLRSTGVHCLSDRQASELLECTTQMMTKEEHFSAPSSFFRPELAN